MRNPRGGILEVKSLGEESWKRNPQEGLLEESQRRNPGGSILGEGSQKGLWGHLQRALGAPPESSEGIWGTPRAPRSTFWAERQSVLKP